MGRAPENRYLVAVREFPRRLAQAKKRYELERRGGEDLDWDELAALAHLTKSVMSELKLGKRPPRLAEVVVFSTVLSCRPEWLAFESGLMTEEGQQPLQFGDPDAAVSMPPQQDAKRRRHGG